MVFLLFGYLIIFIGGICTGFQALNVARIYIHLFKGHFTKRLFIDVVILLPPRCSTPIKSQKSFLFAAQLTDTAWNLFNHFYSFWIYLSMKPRVFLMTTRRQYIPEYSKLLSLHFIISLLWIRLKLKPVSI